MFMDFIIEYVEQEKEDFSKYYYYRPYCNKYYYGDPYEGFWVLGEPAQSCNNACIDYNMTCDKQKHLFHLPELIGNNFGGILNRFNLSCDSYTSEWLNNGVTPVYNSLTRACVLSNTSIYYDNWDCNSQPKSNYLPSER